jgi:hypothetical protein
MSRICIFCGDRANSVEDAFPRWLTGRFIGAGEVDAQMGIDAPPIAYRTNRPTHRIRKVCSACNNGWMSRLENRVIPVITRLLDEPNCTLDLHECNSLSRWAVKTSMVCESVNEPAHWIHNDLERTLISQRDEMPPFSVVWIAKCVGFSSIYSMARNLGMGAGVDVTGQPRASVATFVFGELAIQVRKIVPRPNTPPSATITVEERPGPWQQIVLQVWPPPSEPICWPARVGIASEDGLDMFAERFSPATQATVPAV